MRQAETRLPVRALRVDFRALARLRRDPSSLSNRAPRLVRVQDELGFGRI
jgi:hypothetical protein